LVLTSCEADRITHVEDLQSRRGDGQTTAYAPRLLSGYMPRPQEIFS